MTIEEIIIAAGGIPRGRMNEAGYELVLFDNPRSGTTLAMAAHEITDITAVKLHLTTSNLKFALAQLRERRKVA